MTAALLHYLENVKNNLRLDPSAEREIIAELRTHVEDKFQELRELGLSEEEAVKAEGAMREAGGLTPIPDQR